MGRPAQSKATLKRHGTFRKDRHGKGELAPSEPTCPTWLCKEAKTEWKRIVSTLVSFVGLNEIDRSLLAVYCQTWAEYQRAINELAKDGEWYETQTTNGVICRLHPMVQIRNAARDALLKYGSKLGLSPSARTGLNIGSPEPNEDAKKKFLG